MRKIVVLAVIGSWLAALLLVGSTAQLSQMRASRDVDPRQQSPVGISETYSPNDKAIYLTVKLSDAPPGTQVRIAAYYLQGSKPLEVAVQEFPDIYGTGYLSLKITPPTTGWLIGRYKAIFQLNRQERGSVGFIVAADKADPVYRMFTSLGQGFSVQYPAGWVEGERGTGSVACMFLANPDNSPVSSLNVQVIPITGGDDSQAQEAVNLVAQQLIDQIKGFPNSRIHGDMWTMVGAISGRELDSEYVYQNAKIRQRQFLTYHANNVFVLILTADQSVYTAVADHYFNAAKTMKFLAK